MTADDPLWEALERVEACLLQQDTSAAETALAAAAAIAGDEHPEVLYARACIASRRDGVLAAEPLLNRVVSLDDAHADAHYMIAQAAEERGDRACMIEHFLRVQVLDARDDRAARIGGQAALDHIERVARKVLADLPSPFAERLQQVPVVLDKRPARSLVREGFDPRALGLFEGPVDGDLETPAPSRIVLFVNNLLADFPDEPELSEEIEITLLHEIGHYFGLDEEDMVRLGLD